MTLASFRDPEGQLLLSDSSALRVVVERVREQTLELLHGPLSSLMSAGKVVRTQVHEGGVPEHLREFLRPDFRHDEEPLILDHERAPFLSYPHEWCADMLFAAAKLTLDIALELPTPWGLKDATPYNVVFFGAKPVFVDVLSFEKRDPSDPIWKASDQFLRTFLYPLLADKGGALDFRSAFLASRSGLSAQTLFRSAPLRTGLDPRRFFSVTLPALLRSLDDAARGDIYTRRWNLPPSRAKALLKRHLGGRLRQLNSARPERVVSRWSQYSSDHSPEYFEAKFGAAERLIRQLHPTRVLDIGCNSGAIASLAAKAGCKVVAIDADPAMVADTFRLAQRDSLDILPLVIDLTHPTPATGWRNEEHQSFLSRARGFGDCVTLFAVMHHLIVQGGLTLESLLQTVCELTTRDVLFEFIPPDDPMFRRIARGRGALYAHLTREHFERVAAQRFTVMEIVPTSTTGRAIYHMRRSR